MTNKTEPKTYSGSGQILAATLRRQAQQETNPLFKKDKLAFADKAEAVTVRKED